MYVLPAVFSRFCCLYILPLKPDFFQTTIYCIILQLCCTIPTLKLLIKPLLCYTVSKPSQTFLYLTILYEHPYFTIKIFVVSKGIIITSTGCRWKIVWRRWPMGPCMPPRNTTIDHCSTIKTAFTSLSESLMQEIETITAIYILFLYL